jgi:hypothetical protein
VALTRTGFDLLLQTLKLPVGSEVLCSAITIPDMLYVLRYHGLVPVPVDLDPQTLAVDVELLKQAITGVSKRLLRAWLWAWADGRRAGWMSGVEIENDADRAHFRVSVPAG